VDEQGKCSPFKLSMHNDEFGPLMVFRWRYDCSLQSAMVELRDIEKADGTTSAPVNCGVTAPTGSSTGQTYSNPSDSQPAPAAPTTFASSVSSGCQNPIRGVSNLRAERIDQGVDYAGSGPVYAACDGVIEYANYNDRGWPGH